MNTGTNTGSTHPFAKINNDAPSHAAKSNARIVQDPSNNKVIVSAGNKNASTLNQTNAGYVEPAEYVQTMQTNHITISDTVDHLNRCLPHRQMTNKNGTKNAKGLLAFRIEK